MPPRQMPKAGTQAARTLAELAPTGPGITSRAVFGQPTCFVNGNMFLGTFGEKLFVRLGEEDQVEAVKIGMSPFEPMPGRAMKGYFVLTAALLARRADARRWVERSLRFTRALPAKSPKKR